MEPERQFSAISITTGTMVRAVLVLLLVWFLFAVRDVVLVVLAAVVIASAVEPATVWFTRHRIGRLPAVILVYVLAVGVLAGLFYLLVPPLLQDASDFLSRVPTYLSELPGRGPLADNAAVQSGREFLPKLPDAFSFVETLQSLRDAFTSASESFFRAVSAVFGGALSFLLIVVLSFYLAVQEDGVTNFLKIVAPVRNQRYVIDLWKRSQRKIGLWLQGQLLLGVIVGVLVYLGLMVLGVKNALLLAIIAGVFEIIPVFGPILAALPAILVGFAQGGLTTGLLVIGLYLIIQQFENHLIYPLVVRKIVGVSPIVVILALVIGAKLAGFLGILLSVPAAAAIMEYIADVGRRKELPA